MYELKENIESKYYFIEAENKIAKIEYIKTKDKIYLPHTEVPRELNGKGIGSALAKLVLEKIKKDKLTLVPLCPFVAMYIKKHPEWKEIVSKDIKID